MIGWVFSSPTNSAFETITSQFVKEMDVFKELQAYYLETN